jgi:hypothetical protein
MVNKRQNRERLHSAERLMQTQDSDQVCILSVAGLTERRLLLQACPALPHNGKNPIGRSTFNHLIQLVSCVSEFTQPKCISNNPVAHDNVSGGTRTTRYKSRAMPLFRFRSSDIASGLRRPFSMTVGAALAFSALLTGGSLSAPAERSTRRWRWLIRTGQPLRPNAPICTRLMRPLQAVSNWLW